jgi:hypothetical protein
MIIVVHPRNNEYCIRANKLTAANMTVDVATFSVPAASANSVNTASLRRVSWWSIRAQVARRAVRVRKGP